MKRLVMALALLLALSTGSLWAQDVPKAEVFGGGSVMNIESSGLKLTPFGWQASVNGNVHDVVGIVGDFGGHYRKSVNIHSFLGGVQFTRRADKASVFAQAKLGGVRSGGSGSGDTNLALGFGGGVDYNLTDQLAFRVIQFDWMPVKDGSTWTKNITRGGIGIVWKSAAR